MTWESDNVIPCERASASKSAMVLSIAKWTPVNAGSCIRLGEAICLCRCQQSYNTVRLEFNSKVKQRKEARRVSGILLPHEFDLVCHSIDLKFQTVRRARNTVHAGSGEFGEIFWETFLLGNELLELGGHEYVNSAHERLVRIERSREFGSCV
jgi:hypothetical protein